MYLKLILILIIFSITTSGLIFLYNKDLPNNTVKETESTEEIEKDEQITPSVISPTIEEIYKPEVEKTIVKTPIPTKIEESQFDESKCIAQKKQVIKELEKKYIELWEKRSEERIDFIGDCYEEKSVPECDSKMSKFNVETVELQRNLVNSYKQNLKACSQDLRNFGDVSDIVPGYF